MNNKIERLWHTEWLIFLILIFIALFVRVAFHTGYMGSDEVTYTQMAFRLLDGNWSVSNYVGANRYGINLPVAAFSYLFGRNEFAANLYSLLCSVTEIGLIFLLGRMMFGLRCAVISSIVLIFLPIHVHYAGRLLADPPLSMMMTASFFFFWYGETKESLGSFFIAGLAAGLSFWIKPQVIMYLLIFIIYPLFFFRWNWKWGWMLAGFFLAIAGNNLLLWVLTNDPLYILKSIYSRQTSGYLETGNIEDSPVYYLKYFFFKIYHTWLLIYLSVSASLVWFFQRKKILQDENDSLKFIMLWFYGLVIIFSLLIVSWSPLLFIPKQANYMLMFVAPASLLAGYTLAKLRGTILGIVLCAVIVPSIIFAILHQSHIHVFTANSKAAVCFAQQNKEAEIFSHTNPLRAANYHNLFVGESQGISIQSISQIMGGGEGVTSNNAGENRHSRYVIIDTETLWWNPDKSIHSLSDVPSCWVLMEKLKPIDFGLGWKIIKFVGKIGQLMPPPMQGKIVQIIDGFTVPKPAYVYKIPESCI